MEDGGPLKEFLKTDAFITGKTGRERSPGALGIIKTSGVYSLISKYVLSTCILRGAGSLLGTEDIGGEHG